MLNDLMLIFLIAVSLFIMRAVDGVFQIKNYKAAIRRVRKKGNVGTEQKEGRFFNGNIMMITCDNNHIVTACEVMGDKTFLARFHPANTLPGKTIDGISIDKFLEQFRSMDPKRQKQYRGYIQTLEALGLHFRNTAGAQEMDTVEHLPYTVMD